MFDECLAAVRAANLYGHFHGGPLRIFFYKLCKLLKSPAIFIFVFDGRLRPPMKRGRKINVLKDPWWTEPCTELINSMGFYAHQVSSCLLYGISLKVTEKQAPGEAEAELGRLSQLGIIDAVISTDGDAFVFGAHRVLKRYEFTCYYNKYEATKLTSVTVSLSLEDFTSFTIVTRSLNLHPMGQEACYFWRCFLEATTQMG